MVFESSPAFNNATASLVRGVSLLKRFAPSVSKCLFQPFTPEAHSTVTLFLRLPRVARDNPFCSRRANLSLSRPFSIRFPIFLAYPVNFRDSLGLLPFFFSTHIFLAIKLHEFCKNFIINHVYSQTVYVYIHDE